jgi:hypothetical protein
MAAYRINACFDEQDTQISVLEAHRALGSDMTQASTLIGACKRTWQMACSEGPVPTHTLSEPSRSAIASMELLVSLADGAFVKRD